ncbi:MAG: hypothetical protein QM783_13370 [Phycisphaerales bacterium]
MSSENSETSGRSSDRSLVPAGLIALQALVKGIPNFGEPLYHLLFAHSAERQQQRVIETLTEVEKRLRGDVIESLRTKEEFAILLESVLKDVSRAQKEEKRAAFRDILIGAAALPPGSPQWDEAEWAARVTKEIDVPGLAILAGIYRTGGRFRTPGFPYNWTTVVQREYYELYFDLAESPSDRHPVVLPYPVSLIDYWVPRLRERHLLGTSGAKPEGATVCWALTELGNLYCKWAILAPRS